MYFFKEFLPMDTSYITLEITGISENSQLFKLCNDFYRKNGTYTAYTEPIGSWLDLQDRKLIAPCKEILCRQWKSP